MTSVAWATDRLVQWCLPLLLMALVLAGLAVWPASRLRFDQSIESFYAPDNPHLQAYRQSKSLFGGDEFVIVAFSDPHLFAADGSLSPASARQIREFAARLSQIPGVHGNSTQHLADALATERFVVLMQQREKLLELFEGWLVGEDRQTTAIVLRLQPRDRTTTYRRETIAEIRRVAREYHLPTHVVGEPVLVHDTFRYVQDDGALLGWASMGLLVLVIAVIFRRLRWVILPVLVVEVTIVWTKAVLVLTNLQLSMVSSMLNSLLMVVGTATVMHLAVRYGEHRVQLNPEAATRQTFRDLTHAIFWTTVTTAAGFAAQLTSHVTPVRSFALMMAIGSMLVFFATVFVAPGAMLIGRQENVSAEGHATTRTGRGLSWLNSWVEQYPLWLWGGCLVLVAFSLVGMLWLRVETDFSKNFRAGTPIVQALEVVETRLGGASVWEVGFPAPAELDAEFLDRVRRLAEKLRELEHAGRPQLTKVVAFTDGLDLVPLLPVPAKRVLLRRLQPEFEPGLYNRERNRMRIILRARERQRSEDRLRVIDDVERLARAEFPEARTAGLFVLLTHLTASLLEDQWVSFALGAGMIITLMAIAFRSLPIGLISLIPNLLPIVFVIGTMGWLGLPVSLGTAMISSISMGLTVDSSIHYFTGFRRAREAGQDVLDALRSTTQGVGTALIYANLALIAGFLVLTLSHFMPLVYFGLLVSVAMLGGLIGNLILLPLLIRAFRV